LLSLKDAVIVRINENINRNNLTIIEICEFEYSLLIRYRLLCLLCWTPGRVV